MKVDPSKRNTVSKASLKEKKNTAHDILRSFFSISTEIEKVSFLPPTVQKRYLHHQSDRCSSVCKHGHSQFIAKIYAEIQGSWKPIDQDIKPFPCSNSQIFSAVTLFLYFSFLSQIDSLYLNAYRSWDRTHELLRQDRLLVGKVR